MTTLLLLESCKDALNFTELIGHLRISLQQLRELQSVRVGILRPKGTIDRLAKYSKGFLFRHIFFRGNFCRFLYQLFAFGLYLSNSGFLESNGEFL
ncbi:MAG: hypothetical protein Q8Q74_03290, partial [Polaromonas sp.]|nr:hypothetical protein [Polaromonas sp.]